MRTFNKLTEGDKVFIRTKFIGDNIETAEVIKITSLSPVILEVCVQPKSTPPGTRVSVTVFGGSAEYLVTDLSVWSDLTKFMTECLSERPVEEQLEVMEVLVDEDIW